MKINVIAHVNSKKPRIETDLLGNLHIYVRAPAMENRANIAIIDALTKHFGIKRNQISFLSGQKSKNKTFEL